MIYSLNDGLVVFDAAASVLKKNGAPPLQLRHTEMLLLRCLLDGVSDKRNIIDFVWPNMVVSEGSYHKLIFDLRKKFIEVGLNPELIKTIPRRGCVYMGKFELVSDELDEFKLSKDSEDVGADSHCATVTVESKEVVMLSPSFQELKNGKVWYFKKVLIFSFVGAAIGWVAAWSIDFIVPGIERTVSEQGVKLVLLDGVMPKNLSVSTGVQVIYYKKFKVSENTYVCKKFNDNGTGVKCENLIKFNY
ncbi:winged helix-turn-helix domain-containing protein [Chromobacterium haemolyticum]|uniref:winged helix-turn-helix domain-containing protein n=1 Tax=Chromobacterium haemolyticum TaxID=394935 RepID=UPI001130CBA9|nr:hypothetical protein [Chromobacterium haemolyticum]